MARGVPGRCAAEQCGHIPDEGCGEKIDGAVSQALQQLPCDLVDHSSNQALEWAAPRPVTRLEAVNKQCCNLRKFEFLVHNPHVVLCCSLEVPLSFSVASGGAHLLPCTFTGQCFAHPPTHAHTAMETFLAANRTKRRRAPGEARVSCVFVHISIDCWSWLACMCRARVSLAGHTSLGCACGRRSCEDLTRRACVSGFSHCKQPYLRLCGAGILAGGLAVVHAAVDRVNTKPPTILGGVPPFPPGNQPHAAFLCIAHYLYYYVQGMCHGCEDVPPCYHVLPVCGRAMASRQV